MHTTIQKRYNPMFRNEGWEIRIHPTPPQIRLPFTGEDFLESFRKEYPKTYMGYFPQRAHWSDFDCLMRLEPWVKTEKHADLIAQDVERYLEKAINQKRIRQVRDALNKCKNMDVIEEIGKLLNV